MHDSRTLEGELAGHQLLCLDIILQGTELTFPGFPPSIRTTDALSLSTSGRGTIWVAIAADVYPSQTSQSDTSNSGIEEGTNLLLVPLSVWALV